MLGVISVLFVVTLSVLITRVATIALTYTGLSRESASFQARSAFTGVGFTTSEAEHVVNHPVRRRIVRTLMLLGNAGIVTVMSSLMLGLLGGRETSLWLRILLLFGGLAALWFAASSKHVERRMSSLIERLLKRYTELDVHDYASLLHLAGEYHVSELMCRPGDWLEGRTLAALRLRDEGLVVLGITRANGCYIGVPKGHTLVRAHDTLVLYGRVTTLQSLDKRRRDLAGERAHQQAVQEEVRTTIEEHEHDPAQTAAAGSEGRSRTAP